MTAPTIYENAAPAFLVDNLESACKFYCDVLGFEKKWGWPVEGPDIRIGLAPKHSSGMGNFELNLIDNPKAGPSGTSFIYFHVNNVDQIYEMCKQANADIYLELDDREWGMRDFRVSDPYGNRIGFGEVL